MLIITNFLYQKHLLRCKYVRNHLRTVKELNVIVCYCSNPIDTISRASSFIYCCLFAKASKCKPTRQSFLLKLINLFYLFYGLYHSSLCTQSQASDCFHCKGMIIFIDNFVLNFFHSCLFHQTA